MKRALGYFAMGLAGALIALTVHDRTRSSTQLSSNPTPVETPQVRYVNLANPTGGTTAALDPC
ncbi:MAG: hypothetical protein IPF64_09890 [Flavobacteriales bacterium]|nr:hypothetical protein [Flavobacteriales bacterium]